MPHPPERQPAPRRVTPLAVLAAGGDRDALGRLYAEHHRTLWRWVRARTASDSAADDVCAETWTQVVRSISTYDAGRGTFGTWTYKIAHHKIIDAHRRTSALAANESTWGDVTEAGDPARAMGAAVRSGEADPTAAGALVDDLTLVRWALDGLTPRWRQAVALTVVRGLSNAEAAREMGVSVGAVRVARHRGLAALRAAAAEPGSPRT